MKKLPIPAALGYSIDEAGNVTNNKSGTPVFCDKENKDCFRVINNEKKRVQFRVSVLLKDLFGIEQKPVEKSNVETPKVETKKPAVKKEAVKKEVVKKETKKKNVVEKPKPAVKKTEIKKTDAKPKTGAAKPKENATVKKGVLSELRQLFADGKTVDEIISMGKYNKATIRVQHFLFKRKYKYNGKTWKH